MYLVLPGEVLSLQLKRKQGNSIERALNGHPGHCTAEEDAQSTLSVKLLCAIDGTVIIDAVSGLHS